MPAEDRWPTLICLASADTRVEQECRRSPSVVLMKFRRSISKLPMWHPGASGRLPLKQERDKDIQNRSTRISLAPNAADFSQATRNDHTPHSVAISVTAMTIVGLPNNGSQSLA